jgi:Trk-type K+ transport system membrane component
MAPKHRSGIFRTLYEHKSEPLAEQKIFYRRVLKHFILSTLVLAICLAIGIIGYRCLGPMSWIDALHNASMILGGMGPVVTIDTFGGKIFSSFYALFSGVVFITNFGLLITPIAHRFFHQLNLED